MIASTMPRSCPHPPPSMQPAAMLPLIDFANHDFEPNAKIVPGPSGSMNMVSTRCVLEGEAVCVLIALSALLSTRYRVVSLQYSFLFILLFIIEYKVLSVPGPSGSLCMGATR